MLIPINNVGSVGVVKDIPAHELPIKVWSDARNVVFRNGVVQKGTGHSVLVTPGVAPYGLFPAPSGTQNFWAYTGLAKIRGFLSGSDVDITRLSGDYTGGELDLWNGVLFNGIPIFNNGVDKPQSWNPISLAQPLVDLPNWQATVKAKVVRAFKNYLVALDVTKGATRYGRMVKWSHPAEPGAVPISWDETDATKDAGEAILAEGEDALIDCAPLGQINVIYGELSTWGMQLSGTHSIFRLFKLFDTSGLLAQNCIGRFKGQHFAVTQDDVVVHDGTRIQSVIDDLNRRWLFQNLASTAYYISFVLVNSVNSEIWFCFPYGGGATITLAAIWNWKYNSWTFRELPSVRCGASSLYSPGLSADLWDSGPADAWDSGTGTWGASARTPASETILFSPASVAGIYSHDSGYQFAGSGYRSYVERAGLAVIGLTKEGQVVVDPGPQRMLCAVHPRVIAAAGTTLSIYVGAVDDPVEEAVVWSGPYTFTVGTDVKIDCYDAEITGRYLAVRFEEQGSAAWKLLGYDLDVVPLGLF